MDCKFLSNRRISCHNGYSLDARQRNAQTAVAATQAWGTESVLRQTVLTPSRLPKVVVEELSIMSVKILTEGFVQAWLCGLARITSKLMSLTLATSPSWKVCKTSSMYTCYDLRNQMHGVGPVANNSPKYTSSVCQPKICLLVTFLWEKPADFCGKLVISCLLHYAKPDSQLAQMVMQRSAGKQGRSKLCRSPIILNSCLDPSRLGSISWL